jgi:hypothetical protein
MPSLRFTLPILCFMFYVLCFTPACNRQPVSQRAMSAYNAHDYKTALPLLREWASEVHTDKQQFSVVMGYIVDAEQKTSGKVSGAATPATQTAATTPAPSAPSADNPNLNALTAQATAIANQSAAAGAAPTMETRIPHKPIKPGEIRTLAIKELGNFPFDPLKDADIPEDVKALSGSKVRLRGFMVAWTQADSITDFGLVPSLVSCCFGQPPGPEHVITCRLPKNKALSYTMDEIACEGTLKVNVKREDGYTYSIFELDVTSVKLAE